MRRQCGLTRFSVGAQPVEFLLYTPCCKASLPLYDWWCGRCYVLPTGHALTRSRVYFQVLLSPGCVPNNWKG